jgi:hypothetical protein
MKPDLIIGQFKATIDLVYRKQFLRDDERYHQIVGAYDMAQSMLRVQTAVFAQDTELPEHSTSIHLSELEQLFREFCVPLNVAVQVRDESAQPATVVQ